MVAKQPAIPFWGFNLKHWCQQFLLFYKISLSNKPTKIFTVNSCFQCFYRLYLEKHCLILHQTLFCAKASAQIFLCHVTGIKYYCKFWLSASRCYKCRSLIIPSFRNFSLILSKVLYKCWCEVSCYNSRLLRKMDLKFLTWWITIVSVLQAKKLGEGGICRLHIRGMQWLLYFVESNRSCRK